LSIKQRLIYSNIAMIVLPIILFLLIEIILGIGIFGFTGESAGDGDIRRFVKWRFAALLFAVAITNGLLAYIVSKSFIKPIQHLTAGAAEIAKGNLDYSIKKSRNDEFGELAEAFEAMRIRLKKADALQQQYEENRKELIASISHDLKTPMTSIQGYVKGLLDGVANTTEKRERYLKIIDQKADELDKLIDELFLYSKLDLQREPFRFEPIDLYAYFTDFVEELRFNLPNGTALFNAENGESYLVSADREKLKRAVSNIVQNALKYMDKENPRIELNLYREPDKTIVQISDNGAGIGQDALPYIFDSFYRADASRNSSTGGSGLGLAIAKRIIEGHSGEIRAESQIGTGTAISFTLKNWENPR
jgi:signal transduction histidine kinase